MIPKIIHYCWFGRNSKSEIISKCIESWRKNCPGWEIKEWNEDNVAIDRFPYMKEAYEAGKWAFVSDVARLVILYENGGIYLDTDVELLQPMDTKLLKRPFFIFENGRTIATGLGFGAEKHDKTVRKLLSNYERTHYDKNHFKVNTMMDKAVFIKCFPNLKWDNSDQIVDNVYFMSSETYGKNMKHYGTRSWADLPEYTISGDMKIKRIMRNPVIFRSLERYSMGRKLLPIYTFLAYDLLDMGPIFYLKLFDRKLKRRIRG